MENSPQSLIVASTDKSTFKIKDSKLEWVTARCKEMKYGEIQLLKSKFSAQLGWRLPTVEELKTLVEFQHHELIQPTHGYYWSSEKEVSGQWMGRIRAVSSSGLIGYLDPHVQYAYVRFVRSEACISNSQIIECIDDNKIWVDDQNTDVDVDSINDANGLIVCKNGTVIDVATCLMWTYKTHPNKITIQDAIAMQKIFADFDDWRIPGIEELRTILPSCRNVFPKIDGCSSYWSSRQYDQFMRNSVVDDYGRVFREGGSTAHLRMVRSLDSYPIKIDRIGDGSVDASFLGNRDLKYIEHSNLLPIGVQIKLTAKPAAGSKFRRWQGDAKGTDPIYILNIDGPMSVVAEFEVLTYPLTENKKVFTSAASFDVSNNLIKIDSKNGLMWKIMPELNTVSYDDALKAPEFLGFYDWRLPTKEEFLLLLKNLTAEELAKGFYWTSSKIASNDMLDGYCVIINEDGWSGVCDPQKFGNRLVRYVRTIKQDFSENLTDIFSDLKTSQLTDLSKAMLKNEHFDKLPASQQVFAESFSAGVVNNLIRIDSENGLMWKAMSELNAVSYDDALKATEFLGFSDWRLPTKEEFLLLQKNLTSEGMVKGFYWTSSKHKATDMFDGYCEIINECGLVRLCDPRKFGNRLVRYVRSITSQLSVVDKPDASTVKGKPQGENLTDNNDGTISDYNTGLMWAKFRDGRAKSIQEALGLTCDIAGFVDWRLPSSKELRTISPIDERFFPQPTRGYYFSNTRKKSEVSSSFDIIELVTSAGMTDSILENSTKEAYVRFVRYEDACPIKFTAFGAGSGVVTKRLLDGVKSSNLEIDGYIKNSLIEIRAIPNKGSVFKEWRGDVNSREATLSVLMDAQKSIVVEFELQKHTLTLSELGQGKGRIDSDATATQHPHGSIVTLQATPFHGSVFKGWGGDLSGTHDKALILMDESKIVTAEFVLFFPLTVSISGNGTVQRSIQADECEAGSAVELNAIPAQGHRFVQWLGDATGADPHCTLTIDSPKSVVAEFEVLTYQLTLQITGSGEGSITPSITAAEYPHGSVINLIATPAQGSVFRRWGGDVSGSSVEKRITFGSKKTVTAEFVRVYSLAVSTNGKNQGVVQCSPETDVYEVGSTVKLRAIPAEGHEFVQWHGAAVGIKPACTISMNTNKTVTAEFRQLPKFDLMVTHTGSGRGVVLPTKQQYWKGSVVNLVAKAADGCVFDGWAGDAVGLEATCTVTVNANLAITAAFTRVEVPDADIAVVFDSTVLSNADDREVTVFLFTVTNRTDRQIHINIPFAGYVNFHGEEVEQTAWVKGMISGEKGATLRARTFRKLGLVFERQRVGAVKLGEHLHITVLQSKPAQRLNFSYRCTNAHSQTFELVQASVESLAVENENGKENSNGDSKSGGAGLQAELTARMQLLEKSLQEALSRLSAPAPVALAAPSQTLPEVLAWLCTQNSVPTAVLRQKLLPLGLMPSAVMDDVNERAFDVVGESALDEAAGIVTVQRGVLLQVLAVW